MEIYQSARRHGIEDEDILHAVEHALAVGEQDDAKVLYLGPDRAGNLLEVIAVAREDGSEVVIHAMRVRSKYEPFLRGEGDSDA
ncbi:MAG: toxin [Microbacteriaceae bacterium]